MMEKWPLTYKPGTCGGCAHFKRWKRPDGSPAGRGKCAAKPDVWAVYQTQRACTRYAPKEEEHGEVD